MEYTPIGDVTAVAHPAADRALGLRSGTDRHRWQGCRRRLSRRPGGLSTGRAPATGRSLIECLTYRHSGHSRADPAKYRPAGRARALEGARSDQDLSRAAGAVRRRARNDRGDRGEVRRQSRRGDRSLQGGAAALGRHSHHRRLCRWRLGVAELTYRDAVARGIAQEMARDPDVVFLGEDVAQGRRRVQGHRRPARAVRARCACATRRFPSRRSWARRWARR